MLLNTQCDIKDRFIVAVAIKSIMTQENKMTEESFLSEKLRNFSLLDLILVKLVYLFIGLLVFSLYSRLNQIDWWFYFALTLIATFPLWLHLFSFKGSYIEKTKQYIKTNNPAYQVLLFLSLAFFACLLGTWFPVLNLQDWWYYLIIIIILAIKPLKSNIFW